MFVLGKKNSNTYNLLGTHTRVKKKERKVRERMLESGKRDKDNLGYIYFFFRQSRLWGDGEEKAEDMWHLDLFIVIFFILFLCSC